MAGKARHRRRKIESGMRAAWEKSRAVFICGKQFPCSEQSSDREIYPALASGAHAACKRDGPDDRVGDYAQVERAMHGNRPGIEQGRAEGGARLIPSAPVDFSSDQGRQAIELATESKRRIGVVVSQKLLRKIGAQSKWSAQREDLKRASRAAEGSSS